MIPEICYGHSLETWLCYNKITMFFSNRLYIIDTNEYQYNLPDPFKAYNARLCEEAKG